jgi:hypothetical protein
MEGCDMDATSSFSGYALVRTLSADIRGMEGPAIMNREGELGKAPLLEF